MSALGILSGRRQRTVRRFGALGADLCTSNSDCPGGSCVEGACYSVPSYSLLMPVTTATARPETDLRAAPTQSSWPAGVPSPWWPIGGDPRTKQLQQLLNIELAARQCTTTLKVDGYIGPGSCGALSWLGKTGATPSAASLAFLQANGKSFETACALIKGWKEPACPVIAPSPPPGPSGPVPAQVVAMQRALNVEVLRPNGFVPLAEDGVLTPVTCGTAAQVYNSAQAKQLTISDGLFSLVSDPALYVACGPFKPWQASAKAAVAVTPIVKNVVITPAAPAVSPTMVYHLQELLNEELIVKGYLPIALTSKLDPATCGAFSWAYAAGKAAQLATQDLVVELRARAGVYGSVCQSVPGVAPTPKPTALVVKKPPVAPPPAKRPPVAVAPRPPAGMRYVPGTTICDIRAGDKATGIRLIQQTLNAALAYNGYKPIPETGVWDAPTCGAYFAMKGANLDTTIAGCSGPSVDWLLPNTCPQQVAPTKIVVPAKKKPAEKKPPPPGPIVTPVIAKPKYANMAAWGLGLAALSAGGYYLWKKRKAG